MNQAEQIKTMAGRLRNAYCASVTDIECATQAIGRCGFSAADMASAAKAISRAGFRLDAETRKS